MSKIADIINPSFRSGTSKTGKPWVLMSVRTDDNKEATIFAPAAIGDEVALTYSEQYKNYSAEKVTAQSKDKADIHAKLDEILSILRTGSQGRGDTLPNATNESQSPTPPVDLPPTENYNEPPY